LVYRAGSGSGAPHIGQRVTAVLSVSLHSGPRKEILRVDNADTDPRIEAICRERDAKALLNIPISRDHVVAGLLEVMFRNVATFDDREMRTYRMMGTLAEEAMARDLQLRQKRALTTKLMPLRCLSGE
jgi:GAF domain-containing protein